MKPHKLHRISYTAKRVVTSFALMCILAVPMGITRADAQIFILSEDEYNNSNRAPSGGQVVPVVPQGQGTDWIYAPLGSGWLLLSGLGGLYLLGKGRKKKE